MPTALKQKTVFHLPTLLPREKEGVKVVLSHLLPLQKISLRVPLALTVEYGPKLTIVSNADLELFGYGDTEREAIQDFAVSFEELYFWLSKEKKRLSKNLKLKYEFLGKIVSEK